MIKGAGLDDFAQVEKKKKIACYPHRYFCRKLPGSVFSLFLLDEPSVTLTPAFHPGSLPSSPLHLPSSVSSLNSSSSSTQPSPALPPCPALPSLFYFPLKGFFLASSNSDSTLRLKLTRQPATGCRARTRGTGKPGRGHSRVRFNGVAMH